MEIDDLINSVNELKLAIVNAQRYELAAMLRNLEKHLMDAKDRGEEPSELASGICGLTIGLIADVASRPEVKSIEQIAEEKKILEIKEKILEFNKYLNNGASDTED